MVVDVKNFNIFTSSEFYYQNWDQNGDKQSSARETVLNFFNKSVEVSNSKLIGNVNHLMAGKKIVRLFRFGISDG